MWLLQVLLVSLHCLSLQAFLLSSSPSYFPPSLYPASPGLPTSRVICSACSCDDDFFCGWNCGKCSEPEFCSSCGCTTSLGCARNCAKCSDSSQPADPASPPSSGCLASGGPAAGSPCIFPFIYDGVRYEGCAPLYGGLANTYTSVYWCSTKVDFNGFHIRGSFDNQGKYVGFCDDTCPKISGIYYWI